MGLGDRFRRGDDGCGGGVLLAGAETARQTEPAVAGGGRHRADPLLVVRVRGGNLDPLATTRWLLGEVPGLRLDFLAR